MREKLLLRRHSIRQRASLSYAEVQTKSAMIASYVSQLCYFCSSATLMTYMALPQEVQTLCLIKEARRQRKRLVVPVLVSPELVAVELPQDCSKLHANAYGILEPDDLSARVDPAVIDCILVPGVAFDPQGGRLGFGKGYYDRFLSKVPATTYLCGLAFTIQIVQDIPQMPHDICMHVLVTEQGPLSCRPFPPTL
jgi:5-formyltetrahydrofolate cyclo-ligase